MLLFPPLSSPTASSSISMLTSSGWADPPPHPIHHHTSLDRAPTSNSCLSYSLIIHKLSLKQLFPNPYNTFILRFPLTPLSTLLYCGIPQTTILSMPRLGIYVHPHAGFSHHKIDSLPARLRLQHGQSFLWLGQKVDLEPSQRHSPVRAHPGGLKKERNKASVAFTAATSPQ